MNNKLNILILLAILFQFAHPRQAAISVEIDKQKDIKLESTELYVYSQASKDGSLIHIITLNKKLDKYKEKIFYTTVDDAKTIDQTEQFNTTKVLTEQEKDGKYRYYNAFLVKKNQYGITKVKGLTKGDTVNVEVKYETNTTLYIIIGIIIIVACCILCLVLRCVKKMCC